MSWLRRRSDAAPGESATPGPELGPELQRLADELRAAADAAPPPRRADEARMHLLAQLDEEGGAPRPGGLPALVAVAGVALVLAVLIGLGGAYVGSLLEDRPAVPTPAEVDLAPVPSPSERAVPSEPAAKMMLEVPRVPSGDATGDPPASVPPAAQPLPTPPPAGGDGGGAAPPTPAPTPPPQASPGGPPLPLPTPPMTGPPPGVP